MSIPSEPSAGAGRSRSAQPLVVGYDGSPAARNAIARAAALFPGRRAVVVNAWTAFDAAPELMLAPGGVVVAAAGSLSDAMRERAEELVEEGARLAVEAGLEAEGRALRTTDAHWEAVIGCAHELGAEVIVLGRRGRSAIAAAILGSVATGVVNHSTLPVLIVPE